MAVTSQQIQMARKAGYSDDEIVAHLADTEPQMKTAIKAGYSPTEIMAHFDNPGQAVTGDINASPADTERMRREFVAKEGTLGTRVKENLRSAATPAEIPRFIADAGVATINAGMRGLKSVASTVQGGGEAIRQGSIDAGLQKYAQKQAEFEPMQSPLQPSGIGQAFGEVAGAGVSKLSDLTGRPDIVEPVAQGVMDIGALLGVRAAAKPTLRTLGNVADTATMIPRAAVADTARAAANKLTDMTLKQSTVLKPEIRAKNIKTAQEGGFLPNSKGVDNLNAAIASTEKALADGIAAGDAAQVKGTLDKAISNIQSLREKANRSSDPAANNALIDAEISRLQSHPLLDETGAVNIGTLQKMKVEQGRELAKTYGGEKATQFQNSIDKARVRGMKEELESALDGAFPELAATNRKLGDYYNLKKSLERAANRIENNQGIGIGLPIKGGAGATMGGMVGGAPGAAVGAGIGTLIGIIEHPAVAPRLALQLYKASKGSMTMKEAKATVAKRIADLSFVDHAVRKGKDQRGMVGKDINASDFRQKAIADRDSAYQEYARQLDKERPSNSSPNTPQAKERLEIPSLTLDQIPKALGHSGFSPKVQRDVVRYLKEVVSYGDRMTGKPDKSPIFGKAEIQEALDALGIQGRNQLR